MNGDGINLHCTYTADELKYMNFGKLYNVRNVIEVNTNNVSERLTWCNWRGRVIAGHFRQLAFVEIWGSSFDPGVYSSEYVCHGG